MTATWYITRRAKTDGPASVEMIKTAAVGPLPTTKLLELASTGEVGADDLVRMDGTDVLITLAQFLGLALGGKLPGFESSARGGAPSAAATRQKEANLPDWLDDVVQSEKPPPKAPVVPDWLEDLRQSEKLSPDSPANKATVAEVALDWLDDIRQIEDSLRHRPTPPTEAAPAPKAPSEPSPGPVKPPRPTTPMTGRAAPRQPAPERPKQHGYDPETGEILDPVAYALFQKTEAQRRLEEEQKQPAVSVAEVFLDAQRALQEWVDDDANRTLVTAGAMEPIRKCASVKLLLARYGDYGSVMQEKLCKRLAFLVENRRKFLKAFC